MDICALKPGPWWLLSSGKPLDSFLCAFRGLPVIGPLSFHFIHAGDYMHLQGNLYSLYNTAAGRCGLTRSKLHCEPESEASTISIVGTWCGG
jgi:hypothetical protein